MATTGGSRGEPREPRGNQGELPGNWQTHLVELPAEVAELSSFLELVSWAMSVYADHPGDGNLDSVLTADTGKSTGVGGVAIDYDGWPSHVHAQWFLRMGKGGETDYRRVGSNVNPAAYRYGGKVNDWMTGDTLKELHLFCKAAAIPEPVETYLKRRYRLFKQLKTFPVSFDPDAVKAAVAATHAANHTSPGPATRGLLRDVVPTAPDLPVSPLVPDRPQPVPGEPTARLLLTALGHPVAGCVTGAHAVMARARLCDPGVLVSPDATLLAHIEDGRLLVARVNRVSTAMAAWPAPVDLRGLGDGEVLAIGAAGPRDLGFVWASDEGTDLYRATPGEEAPTLRGRLSRRRATAAVLRGAQALLAVPERNRARSGAFPDLAVETLTAAHSGGRLFVLATGTDPNGRPVAAVEQDGRQVTELDGGDHFLTFDMARQTVPSLVTADGTAVLLSPDDRPSEPYAHWLPHTASREYAPA